MRSPSQSSRGMQISPARRAGCARLCRELSLRTPPHKKRRRGLLQFPLLLPPGLSCLRRPCCFCKGDPLLQQDFLHQTSGFINPLQLLDVPVSRIVSPKIKKSKNFFQIFLKNNKIRLFFLKICAIMRLTMFQDCGTIGRCGIIHGRALCLTRGCRHRPGAA